MTALVPHTLRMTADMFPTNKSTQKTSQHSLELLTKDAVDDAVDRAVDCHKKVVGLCKRMVNHSKVLKFKNNVLPIISDSLLKCLQQEPGYYRQRIQPQHRTASQPVLSLSVDS